VQVSQLGQNRILFGGAFQSPQRAGRSGDEPPAEDFLDELSPPPWREDEVAVERDAARVRVDRRDLNLFVVRDTKGQPGIEHELPRRANVEHVESDAQHAGSKCEMIARAHWARGAFDQLGPGPLRQFARVREQVPNALGGGEEDLGLTDFHTTVSLTPVLHCAHGRVARASPLEEFRLPRVPPSGPVLARPGVFRNQRSKIKNQKWS
jgi:hypothetical protein